MAAMSSKRPLPSVADAELTVLKALWEGGPGTVREVLERLGREQDWAYTTVQTLLSRLQEKGYVATDRRELAHVFRPVIRPEELAGKRVEELAASLLDGAVAPLLLRLVEQGRFTPAEIASFRALLDQAARPPRGRADG